MNRHPIDLSVLCQRLAANHGIHPARDPSQFPYSAEIVGLTPTDLGYDQCAGALHALRRTAAAATDGEYALSVTRAPDTGERRGYAVFARDQMIADQIAATIRATLR